MKNIIIITDRNLEDHRAALETIISKSCTGESAIRIHCMKEDPSFEIALSFVPDRYMGITTMTVSSSLIEMLKTNQGHDCLCLCFTDILSDETACIHRLCTTHGIIIHSYDVTLNWFSQRKQADRSHTKAKAYVPSLIISLDDILDEQTLRVLELFYIDNMPASMIARRYGMLEPEVSLCINEAVSKLECLYI